MAAIVTRDAKGSKLTKEEVDANFINLNADKLEGTVFAENNSLLIRDADGNLTHVVISADRLVGRLTGGNIGELDATDAKTLLNIQTADVDGLDAALANKADDTDITTLTGYFGGKKIVHAGSGALVSGNLTVSWAGFAATDDVFAFHQSFDSAVGFLGCSAKSDGVSFTITSSNASDANTVSYFVLRDI